MPDPKAENAVEWSLSIRRVSITACENDSLAEINTLPLVSGFQFEAEATKSIVCSVHVIIELLLNHCQRKAWNFGHPGTEGAVPPVASTGSIRSSHNKVENRQKEKKNEIK